jgi:hypothetical protein
MYALIMWRGLDNSPLIGPFATADAAMKHLQGLPRPDPNVSWKLAPLNKPIKSKPPKKPKAKKKAKGK